MEKKLFQWIAAFGIIKLFIHLLTSTNYGLHRDEYLYWDEAYNLSWGFMEIPPLTPFLGRLFFTVLGDSVFAIRLMPALIGTATILLIGWAIKELGGKKWAIGFGCTGFLISLAFLRGNSLYQPVSFNQFFWFLSAFLLIRLIRTADNRYWYYLGICLGLGVLTKYSIAFYGLGLFIGVILSSHRKWLLSPQPYFALLIALIIISPNLYWQYVHHFPVVQHMRELSETQLVHVDFLSFFTDQLLFHFAGTIVWGIGLISLFTVKKYKEYRILGIAFIATILVIALLRGKSYYTIGAFTSLFIFGGLALENIIQRPMYRISAISAMVLFTLPILPFSLFVLPNEKMINYSKFMADHIGLDAPLRWEDGTVHTLPQDYADMNGWEELSKKLGKHYNELPESVRQRCHILGGSYGHASSINYYHQKYKLPRASSFNGTHLIWLSDQIQFDNQFLISDTRIDSSTWFYNMTLIDSIENPYARDPGYIYYRTSPRMNLTPVWTQEVRTEKERFNFK